MADFVQTMKDWRRMCSAMCSCNECPMNEVKCWAKSPSDLIDSFDRRESVITEWAAEHPEQVYPTWGEWLNEQGVVIKTIDNGALIFEPTAKMRQPIHADMAEKLGIEPKEG